MATKSTRKDRQAPSSEDLADFAEALDRVVQATARATPRVMNAAEKTERQRAQRRLLDLPGAIDLVSPPLALRNVDCWEMAGSIYFLQMELELAKWGLSIDTLAQRPRSALPREIDVPARREMIRHLLATGFPATGTTLRDMARALGIAPPSGSWREDGTDPAERERKAWDELMRRRRSRAG